MKYKVTAYGAWVRKYATWAGEGSYDYHQQTWPIWLGICKYDAPIYFTLQYA